MKFDTSICDSIPLQESSKQNMGPLIISSATPPKGFKTGIQGDQHNTNHLKLIEENKPPDAIGESMDYMEEIKENDSSNTVVLMQDDKDMGVGISPSQVRVG